MAIETGKIRQNLETIKQNPEKYLLGSLPVELKLPRRKKNNMSGISVTFSPDQAHKDYLAESNRSPMADTLEHQKSIYAKQIMPDGRQLIIANTFSPYTIEGDHLIIWCPSKDGTKFQQSFRQMGIDQGQEALKITSSIATEFQQQNGNKNFFIGMNVQSNEFQRQSVQSIRDAVHIHAVRLSEKDIANFNDASSKRDRHEFADSFSNLTSDLFSQLVARQLPEIPDANVFFDEAFHHRDYQLEYPKGYFFKLSEGWKTLEHEGFFPFMVEMQKRIENAYREIRDVFVDSTMTDMFRFHVGENGNGKEEFFTRPMPFPNDVIKQRLVEYLEKHPEVGDERTKKMLFYLANTIKPASDVLSELSEPNTNGSSSVSRVNVRHINTKMFMDGLGYNILFFPDPRDESSVVMSVVPRVTSAGSPLDAFGIKKTQYEVEDAEFEKMLYESDSRRDKIVHNLMARHADLKAGLALKGRPDM